MFAQFFVLFSIMGVGFLGGRLGGIDEKGNNGIGWLLMQVAMPALLLNSIFSLDIGGGVLADFFLMAVISIGWFLLFALLSRGYAVWRRLPIGFGNMTEVSMLSTNNGFMGFPIALAFFGEKGLFFMVAHNLIMNVFLFSYGVYKLRRAGETTEIKRRHPVSVILEILNINVITIFLGLALSLTGMVEYIPDAVRTLVSLLSGLATPLSMIYIGATLAGSRGLALSHDHKVVAASVVRLTLYPALILGLCLLLPIPPMMSQILFLAAVLPTAAIVPVMTGTYANEQKEEATKIVLFSTVISLATTPLGVFIGTTLFG